jgi:putative transposase
VSAEIKLELLGLIDRAVAGGWAHARACRVLELADVRAHRWRQRLHERDTLEDRGPGGGAVHGLLAWEERAILDLIDRWGWVDRSHRKLAHRGSYTGVVFVSPSTLLRVALKHRVVLPGEPVRPRPVLPAMPQVPWEKNRIWMWDATHFTRCKRVAYAIVDVVTRYWIGYLLSTEQTTTQAQLLFASALEDQGLLGADGRPIGADRDGPILVAWSDNGSEMTAIDTRQFMALMAIAQHHGRPGTPTDQAHVESLFSHLKGDWPHLSIITDPAALDSELGRIRREYNTVRLDAAIGYVTSDDEHHGRGPQIRRARAAGLRRACRADQAESSQEVMTTTPSIDRANPLVLQRDGACLREGVARSHGRERNWARTKPRTSTANRPHQQPQRWVEKVGRSG